MIRRPPKSTRTYTLFPSTTRVRSRFLHHCNDRLDQTRQSRTRGKVTDQNSSSSLRSRRSNGGACACSLKFARLHHLVLDESRKRVRRTPITPSSIRFANARSEEHTSHLQYLMPISYAVFCLKKKQSSYIH